MSLSERTMAEMRAGGRSVGRSDAEAQGAITGVEAWKVADVWVKKFAGIYPDGGINVTAERKGNTDVWEIATIVYRSGQQMLTLDFEPVESYPSGKLLAQLALLFG